jgi:hypothetical protein
VKEMVVEFRASKNKLLESKLYRFNQLKIGYFEQNLSETEENELNEIEKWLKIHNN